VLFVPLHQNSYITCNICS